MMPDTFRRCNALYSGSKSAGRSQRTAIGIGQQVLPVFNEKAGGGKYRAENA